MDASFRLRFGKLHLTFRDCSLPANTSLSCNLTGCNAFQALIFQYFLDCVRVLSYRHTCSASNATMSTVDPAKLSRRLSSIKHVLLVLSGKGGVGKSSVAVQLALSLLDRPAGDDESEDSQPRRIGLLDVDLTGPSIPRMLGLDGAAVHQSADGWVPVYLPLKKAGQDDDKDASQTNGQASKEGKETAQNGVHGRDDSRDEFKVMSIGFLLRDSRQAVVWRGPKKSAMIRQFLADVRWGELDWLIIDTPPGNHLPLLELKLRHTHS